MPNHYHLLIHEVIENGISEFMHKLGTAYTMYFNAKNTRVGNLFVKPFRSRHVDSDTYLRHVTQYIHLNPVELFEPKWDEGGVKNIRTLENSLMSYKYSSCADYFIKQERVTRAIISPEAFETLASDLPSFRTILEDKAAYMREMGLY